MCICINCRHVHNCQTYWFIRKQHSNYSKNLKIQEPTIVPTNTVINININKSSNYITIDWDLVECLSFTEKPGYWLTKNNYS